MSRFLRFSASRKCSTFVSTGENFDMMKTSAPRLKIFPATYPSIPATKVTTAITAATPITIASTDSTERSLLAHNDWNATRMASAIFMNQASGFGLQRDKPTLGNYSLQQGCFRGLQSTQGGEQRRPKPQGRSQRLGGRGFVQVEIFPVITSITRQETVSGTNRCPSNLHRWMATREARGPTIGAILLRHSSSNVRTLPGAIRVGGISLSSLQV